MSLLRSLSLALAASALGLALPDAALANGAPVGQLVIDIFGTNGSQSGSDQQVATINPDGSFSFAGSSTTGLWDVTFNDVSGNADPVLAFDLSADNPNALDLDFTITFTLPVSVSLPSTLTSGTVAYTLTDNTLPNDGATLSTLTGIPLYQSRLDGVDHVSLFDDPFSDTAFPGGSAVGSAFFGLPGQTTPGGPLTSTLAVELNFTLTGDDDAVSLTGNFIALPEPGAGLLLGMATLTLVVRARRRRVAA